MQTEKKGTVLLKNVEELKNFTKTEEAQLYNAVKAIAESGAKVLVSGGRNSDLRLDYAIKMRLMTVRYFFLISKQESTAVFVDLIQSWICDDWPSLSELLCLLDSLLRQLMRWDSVIKFV